MKSLTGKFTSVRGWALLLALLLGAGMMISACGDEEVPTPTTPAPPTPTPTPTPPAPEPTPEPEGPATPEGLRVSATTSTSITWTWNAVEGALGYQGQFSTDATFVDVDPTFLIVAPNTSQTVQNLQSNTSGHFRVRSGAGTSITDLQYSDWSDGVSGSTSAPPPAVPLDAPGNVGTSDVQRTSIAVTWDEVDDADHYEVEQRAGGGSWVDASCGGADDEVDGTRCVASGLDQGTSYDFRVRAVPASSDSDSRVSAWSTSDAVTTSGTTPREPIAGGSDELNITWESDENSITWFWEAASDNRITHLTALLTGAVATPQDSRPSCPALGDTLWSDAQPYAIAREVGSLETGEVRGLCVRRTWMDDEDNVQYGPVSVAWAATAPKITTQTPGQNEIAAGAKDDARTLKTTAIDWFVEMDQGFTYEVRTVSATTADPSELGSCADDASGNTSLTANRDNAVDRFRLSSLGTYTEYKACVRAGNDQGGSDWTDLATYETLPAAPSTLSGSPDFDTAATLVTGTITWSFGSSATMPEQPGGYVARVVDNESTANTEDVTKLTAETCDDPNSGAVATVQEGGSGFEFQTGSLSFSRNASDGKAYTVTALACVRATLDGGRLGPWRSATRTVSVPKQAAGQ